MKKSTELKAVSKEQAKAVIEVVASAKSMESAVNYIKAREGKANQTMLEIAYKLGKIRSEKLFTAKYDTFKDFAEIELGYAKSTASELASVGARFTVLDKGKVICTIPEATTAKLTAVVSLNFDEISKIDFSQTRDEIRKQVKMLKNSIEMKEVESDENEEKEVEVEVEEKEVEVAPVKPVKNVLFKDIENIIVKIQKSDFYGDKELKSLIELYIKDLEKESK